MAQKEAFQTTWKSAARLRTIRKSGRSSKVRGVTSKNQQWTTGSIRRRVDRNFEDGGALRGRITPGARTPHWTVSGALWWCLGGMARTLWTALILRPAPLSSGALHDPSRSDF